MNLPEPVQRAVRTFLQTFIGTIMVSGVLSGFATQGVVDISSLKKLLISALVAGGAALIAYLQNYLEGKDAIPALLKTPAASPEPVEKALSMQITSNNFTSAPLSAGSPWEWDVRYDPSVVPQTGTVDGFHVPEPPLEEQVADSPELSAEGTSKVPDEAPEEATEAEPEVEVAPVKTTRPRKKAASTTKKAPPKKVV